MFRWVMLSCNFIESHMQYCLYLFWLLILFHMLCDWCFVKQVYFQYKYATTCTSTTYWCSCWHWVRPITLLCPWSYEVPVSSCGKLLIDIGGLALCWLLNVELLQHFPAGMFMASYSDKIEKFWSLVPAILEVVMFALGLSGGSHQIVILLTGTD